MYLSMPAEPKTRFSLDGSWWWDGWQWLPAFTPDRLWRFTGEQWVPVGGRGKPPKWLVVTGLGWLVAFTGPLLYATVFIAINGPADPSTLAVYVLVGLAAIAVLATGAWGFLVGRRRALRWLWRAAAIGTAAQIFCYVLAMLAAPSSDGSAQDDAAGAGLAILTVPTALVTLTLLWLGAGVGALSGRRWSQSAAKGRDV